MKTKLIIVEGIPGSGKTTTAQYIRDWLTSKGVKPSLYLEDATYHPVDLDNLSYFDEKQYQQFVAQFETHQPAIEKISEKGSDGYFVHYRCWNEMVSDKMPGDLAEFLYKHDAHDTLPPEKYRALMMERWQRFGAQAKTKDEVFIFECCFLQNPLTIFVGKHNYEIDLVKSFILELAEFVRELKPNLILLRGDSVQETLQRVIGTRPQRWIELVEAYITGQGYGKARKLSGLEGVIRFYKMFQEVEEEVVSHLDWNKLILDNTNWNWELYHQEIEGFLSRSL